MDMSSDAVAEPQTIIEKSTEQLNLKIDEWKDTIERLMGQRFDATFEFVNRVTEKLDKQFSTEVLELPAEDFIEKYIKASEIKDEPEENIGNQTLAALDHIQYLMNAPNHDEKTKEMAAKLQQIIVSKK